MIEELGYFPWIGVPHDGWHYTSKLPVPKAIYFEAETASWLNVRMIVEYLFQAGIDDTVTSAAIERVRRRS